MENDKIETASVLAFERKLEPTDGLLEAGNWGDKDSDWKRIKVREKVVRGTISNRLKTATQEDPTKLDADIQKPNPQTFDVASLPHDSDTLRLRFTLRILGGVGHPCACNNARYQQKVEATISQYIEQFGLDEIAKRYACNLINARFLWRNRLGAEAIEVKIRETTESGDREWTFDALTFSLRNFDIPKEYIQSLDELTHVITEGLTSDQPRFLNVMAYARMSKGQEVFPSQELILDNNRNQKGTKSKTLYEVDGFAAMHSQKIGNAIRTIDNWYPTKAENNLGPIAVEPYGSVTSRGSAYRPPKEKEDFYTLFDSWILESENLSIEQQHFVVATLIRGGVFGQSQE